MSSLKFNSMTRLKRLAKDAKKSTIYLTPEEHSALDIIQRRREKRKEKRDSPSEIVADAIWCYLENVEKMPKSQIVALMPVLPEEPEAKSNLKKFPSKDKIKE